MIVVISPAKTLDYSLDWKIDRPTVPTDLAQTQELVGRLRKLSPVQISKLMGVSPKLAKLNVDRFRAFTAPFNRSNAKPALLAYRGDVYRGLEVDQYAGKDWAFAQEHVRILSGLYGLVRPLDLIQPYRLEMRIPLKNSCGENLYAFWKARITRQMNRLGQSGSKVLINLASQEYFDVLDLEKLKLRTLRIIFKQNKGGTLKMVSILAKRARGMMTNFIIRNRVVQPEGLKAFRAQGYRFSAKASSDTDWVFVRRV